MGIQSATLIVFNIKQLLISSFEHVIESICCLNLNILTDNISFLPRINVYINWLGFKVGGSQHCQEAAIHVAEHSKGGSASDLKFCHQHILWW